MCTLYTPLVELDTRLATVPQPVFHYNILLASLAIESSQLTSSPKTQTPTNSELWIPQQLLFHSIFQQLPGYQPQLDSQLRAPRYMTSGRTVEETVLLALVV
jgi:hypothetical protein